MMFKLHYPWIYSNSLIPGTIDLSLEESKHLRSVLRCRDGEIVVAFDGCGNFRQGRLVLDKICKLVFEGPIEYETMPVCNFSLVQCLPNNTATFEIVLRKACELGVHEIVPVLSDRTEVQHWTNELWNKRMDRFQRIFVESCKQAKNPFIPRLGLPVKFEELPERALLHSVYGSLRTDRKKPFSMDSVSNIACVVGPEGGFSASEEEFLSRVSCGIHLPTYVMRVETAVVALMAVLKHQIL